MDNFDFLYFFDFIVTYHFISAGITGESNIIIQIIFGLLGGFDSPFIYLTPIIAILGIYLLVKGIPRMSMSLKHKYSNPEKVILGAIILVLTPNIIRQALLVFNVNIRWWNSTYASIFGFVLVVSYLVWLEIYSLHQ